MSKAKRRRAAAQKRQQSLARMRIGVLVVLLALTGGYILTVQGNKSAGDAEAAVDPDAFSSYYREVSIQQVANIIETSQHSLVYYRSPT